MNIFTKWVKFVFFMWSFYCFFSPSFWCQDSCIALTFLTWCCSKSNFKSTFESFNVWIAFLCIFEWMNRSGQTEHYVIDPAWLFKHTQLDKRDSHSVYTFQKVSNGSLIVLSHWTRTGLQFPHFKVKYHLLPSIHLQVALIHSVCLLKIRVIDCVQQLYNQVTCEELRDKSMLKK